MRRRDFREKTQPLGNVTLHPTDALELSKIFQSIAAFECREKFFGVIVALCREGENL